MGDAANGKSGSMFSGLLLAALLVPILAAGRTASIQVWLHDASLPV
jgi:hypothetical protein